MKDRDLYFDVMQYLSQTYKISLVEAANLANDLTTELIKTAERTLNAKQKS